MKTTNGFNVDGYGIALSVRLIETLDCIPNFVIGKEEIWHGDHDGRLAT